MSASPTNDAQVVIKFFKKIIFPRFRVHMLVISDQGSQFISRLFKNLVKKYIVRHRLVTPYHSHTDNQVEVSNREIKTIMEKAVFTSRKDCSGKLDNAL